jgi:hypothetical protein
MAVGIVEIDAAAVVPVIDLAGFGTRGARPVRQSPLLDAREDLIELRLAHQERVMLRGDVAVDVDEIQCQVIADAHQGEWAHRHGRPQSQDLAEE